MEKKYLYENGKIYQNNQEFSGKQKGFLKKTVAALNTINSKSTGNNLIKQAENSEKNITIKKSMSNSFKPVESLSDIALNGVHSDGTNERPSFIGLAHELAHGVDAAYGKMDGKYWYTVYDTEGKFQKSIYNYEKQACHTENLIRAEQNISLRLLYQPNNPNSRVLQKGIFGPYKKNTRPESIYK